MSASDPISVIEAAYCFEAGEGWLRQVADAAVRAYRAAVPCRFRSAWRRRRVRRQRRRSDGARLHAAVPLSHQKTPAAAASHMAPSCGSHCSRQPAAMKARRSAERADGFESAARGHTVPPRSGRAGHRTGCARGAVQSVGEHRACAREATIARGGYRALVSAGQRKMVDRGDVRPRR